MKFKIGERVKFLNQSGGGIVVRIISPQMLSIAIEDGFEIPMLISEVLKIEDEKGASSLFRDDKIFSSSENLNVVQKNAEDEVQNIEFERISTIIRKGYGASQMKDGVYLSFVPHEQRWLLTGKLDIYLLNYTANELIFSLFLRDVQTEDFLGQDYDVLPKYSKVLLSTIERDEIVKWSKGVVQGLFHTNHKQHVLNPLNTEFKIKEMRFLKEENYKNSSFLDGKALILSLADLSEVTFLAENVKSTDKELIEVRPGKAKLYTDASFDMHMINSRMAEVDLHIENLSENPELLNPSEMLSIQVNYFEKCLAYAIENKLEQITFIHGVGGGKLKAEIIEILKQYDGLHWFDAPMSKYGVGATQVLIGQNIKKL